MHNFEQQETRKGTGRIPGQLHFGPTHHTPTLVSSAAEARRRFLPDKLPTSRWSRLAHSRALSCTSSLYHVRAWSISDVSRVWSATSESYDCTNASDRYWKKTSMAPRAARVPKFCGENHKDELCSPQSRNAQGTSWRTLTIVGHLEHFESEIAERDQALQRRILQVGSEGRCYASRTQFALARQDDASMEGHEQTYLGAPDWSKGGKSSAPSSSSSRATKLSHCSLTLPRRLTNRPTRSEYIVGSSNIAALARQRWRLNRQTSTNGLTSSADWGHRWRNMISPSAPL